MMTMIEIKHPQELACLRCLALSAQGLLKTQRYGRGLKGAHIDTTSVVERAHHHVLYARVLEFKLAMAPQMLCDAV
jgi:uncharacterized protein